VEDPTKIIRKMEQDLQEANAFGLHFCPCNGKIGKILHKEIMRRYPKDRKRLKLST